jgi:predicted SnoaL-like aldol condensation-catalyzing enzyme
MCQGLAAELDERLGRNRKNVAAFYDLMSNQGKPAEAIRNCAGASYTQYNSHVADGIEPFIACIERMAKEYPRKRVHFRRVSWNRTVAFHAPATGNRQIGFRCAASD